MSRLFSIIIAIFYYHWGEEYHLLKQGLLQGLLNPSCTVVFFNFQISYLSQRSVDSLPMHIASFYQENTKAEKNS